MFVHVVWGILRCMQLLSFVAIACDMIIDKLVFDD